MNIAASPAPRQVMAEIDAALTELPEDARDMHIELFWPHYQELLAIKGMDTNAMQIRTWGSGYEKRPLKVYRNHVLKYCQWGHSLVVYSKPDGGIGGIRIAYERDDDDRDDSIDHYRAR